MRLGSAECRGGLLFYLCARKQSPVGQREEWRESGEEEDDKKSTAEYVRRPKQDSVDGMRNVWQTCGCWRLVITSSPSRKSLHSAVVFSCDNVIYCPICSNYGSFLAQFGYFKGK